ncbi:hypothetical protein [Nafulsella turpanensis]|nr:hypothetical protein [Nafulsella turpanensis]
MGNLRKSIGDLTTKISTSNDTTARAEEVEKSILEKVIEDA